MSGIIGCKQTKAMIFSKVHRSEIWGEIKRQGEKKKQPSQIRAQTQSQRGFQMSDRFDKLQVAFKLFTSSRTQRLTGQAVTEAERN